MNESERRHLWEGVVIAVVGVMIACVGMLVVMSRVGDATERVDGIEVKLDKILEEQNDD